MSSLSRTDWKRVGVLLALLLLGLTVAIYKNEAQQLFKNLFDSGWLTVLLWLYVIVGVIAKQIYTEEAGASVLTKFAQGFFESSGYGVVGSSSLKLLQGIYLQYFFATPFFTSMDGLDIGSIFLASLCLLIYCLVKVTVMYINSCTRVTGYDLAPSE